MNSTAERLTRRRMLQLSSAGLLVGGSTTGWFESLAADAAKRPERKRSCILLWMSGGPSQMDTFDCKPGHRNGGPIKTTKTAVPGMEFADYLPELAKEAKHLAVVRSMSTKEGDHARATYHLRTGNLPQGPIRYPTLGAALSKELESEQLALPSFVSIAPNRFFSPEAFGPGFLGSRYAPLVVGDAGRNTTGEVALKVEDLELPAGVDRGAFDERLDILASLDKRYLSSRKTPIAVGHRVVYDRAVRLMKSAAAEAFNLEKESSASRDRYGRNYFGQGCLLARRLVESGVPFIEVNLGAAQGAPAAWDTHNDGFAQVKSLCGWLDKGWAQLMRDLKDRGLLETTTIVWMGEFGRTPKLNGMGGRDHFPGAWTTVLAGGGIRGGTIVGRTSPDGMSVADRPVGVEDFLATICHAVGVDPGKTNITEQERPIRIVDAKAKPVKEALA